MMNTTTLPNLTALPGTRARSDALQTAHDVVRDGLAEHCSHLMRVALARTGNHADAEDLVQDVCLRALRFAHRFRVGTNLRAWLNTILRNTWINGLATARLRPRPMDVSIVGDVIGAGRERRAQVDPVTATDFMRRRDEFDGSVHDAVAGLDARYRDVLLLSVLDDRRHREIAERLGVPEGTVMSRLFRARLSVRESLDRPAAA